MYRGTCSFMSLISSTFASCRVGVPPQCPASRTIPLNTHSSQKRHQSKAHPSQTSSSNHQQQPPGTPTSQNAHPSHARSDKPPDRASAPTSSAPHSAPAGSAQCLTSHAVSTAASGRRRHPKTAAGGWLRNRCARSRPVRRSRTNRSIPRSGSRRRSIGSCRSSRGVFRRSRIRGRWGCRPVRSRWFGVSCFGGGCSRSFRLRTRPIGPVLFSPDRCKGLWRVGGRGVVVELVWGAWRGLGLCVMLCNGQGIAGPLLSLLSNPSRHLV
jgi:hypothetical protein